MCTEEEDGDKCAAAQQSLENAITMNKMKLLKAKMEDMNLNKKVEVIINLFFIMKSKLIIPVISVTAYQSNVSGKSSRLFLCFLFSRFFFFL